jgi:hypothetical protein
MLQPPHLKLFKKELAQLTHFPILQIMMLHNKLFSVRMLPFFMVLCILLLSTCIGGQQEARVAEPVVYLTAEKNSLVGSAACRKCHQDIYDNYLRTAHSTTSAPANLETVKGSFLSSHNTFLFGKKDSVVMRSTDSGLYQFNYVNGYLDLVYPFDIVVGSGTKGQSYLYWRDKHLFQLAVSYYTNANSWSNSPGFPRQRAHFNRPIHSECMGCHGSFTDVDFSSGVLLEAYNPNNLVMGVNCERCHGPGGNHVEMFTRNPNASGDPLLVNAARLSPIQQLDACGVCHASISKTLNPTVSFRTGDTLEMVPMENLDSSGRIDVHGNQYGMLKRSKCYTASHKITCSTCHNPHKAERSNEALFSQRCMSCHTDNNTDFVKMAPSMTVDQIKLKCITCHLPNQESKLLNVWLDQNASRTPAVMRSHLIRIYPDTLPSISAMIQEIKKNQ